MAPRQNHPNVVFFDLETTGFDRPIRPVQIGAIDSWGQNIYDEFVLPDRFIHHKATRTNGFQVIGWVEGLRIRIRSDPDLFAGSTGSGSFPSYIKLYNTLFVNWAFSNFNFVIFFLGTKINFFKIF